MIEQAITNYISSSPVATNVDGKVYWFRAPKDVTMPWIVVGSAKGPEFEAASKQEADVEIMIYVDDMALVQGRTTAQAVHNLLQNFRGEMAPESDLWITCGQVVTLDGPTGGYRFVVPVRIQYRF